ILRQSFGESVILDSEHGLNVIGCLISRHLPKQLSKKLVRAYESECFKPLAPDGKYNVVYMDDIARLNGKYGLLEVNGLLGIGFGFLLRGGTESKEPPTPLKTT